VTGSILGSELIVVGGDLNGHITTNADGYDKVQDSSFKASWSFPLFSISTFQILLIFCLSIHVSAAHSATLQNKHFILPVNNFFFSINTFFVISILLRITFVQYLSSDIKLPKYLDWLTCYRQDVARQQTAWFELVTKNQHFVPCMVHGYTAPKVEKPRFGKNLPHRGKCLDQFLKMLGLSCTQLTYISALNFTWFASQVMELLQRNRVSVDMSYRYLVLAQAGCWREARFSRLYWQKPGASIRGFMVLLHIPTR